MFRCLAASPSGCFSVSVSWCLCGLCVSVTQCVSVSVSLCFCVSVSLCFCVSVSLCLCVVLSRCVVVSVFWRLRVSASLCLCVSVSLCSVSLCLCVSVSLCLCVSVSLCLLVLLSKPFPSRVSCSSLHSCFHHFLFASMQYSGVFFGSNSFRVVLGTSLSDCKVVPFCQTGLRLRVGLFKNGVFFGYVICTLVWVRAYATYSRGLFCIYLKLYTQD